MNANNLFNLETALEKGQAAIGAGLQQVAKGTQTNLQAVSSQLTGNWQTPGEKKQGNQQNNSQDPNSQAAFQREFIKDLYGKSAQNQNGVQNAIQKIPDDKTQLESLRQRLHSAYVNSLNVPRKLPERPYEEEQKEKEQKMMALEEQKKKKLPPLAIRMQTNRAEQFRGQSG